MTDSRRRRTDAEEAEICRRLSGILPRTGVSVLHQDQALRYLWGVNIPPPWSGRELEGATDADLLPDQASQRLTSLKQEALRLGTARNMEIDFDVDGRIHWYDIRVDPVKDGEAGPVVALTTTIIDTTDQKRREQTLSTLLRELSHRSKNLLAIILSIATQTGRYSTTTSEFLSRFRGRIQSLASSQDLVTLSNWRGAELKDLVRNQTARYSADSERSVSFDGPDVHLGPTAALHVGLGLHELAVNSVSYGALSRADGRVEIRSRLGSDGVLTLHWGERLPAHSSAPAQERFGSVALRRVVPAAIGGSATLTIADARLDYLLSIPPSQFEILP